MFAYLFQKFCDLLERAEHSRRDAYLASSIDISELERRMRQSEVSDLPVTRTMTKPTGQDVPSSVTEDDRTCCQPAEIRK